MELNIYGGCKTDVKLLECSVKLFGIYKEVTTPTTSEQQVRRTEGNIQKINRFGPWIDSTLDLQQKVHEDFTITEKDESAY